MFLRKLAVAVPLFVPALHACGAGMSEDAMTAVEIRHEFADVNGVRLHFATAGEGPLLLFLHGFPEFWYAWRNQLLEFGQDHRAVAVDMRGYNLSSKPEALEAYRVEHLIEDVRALADHLGHGTFTLAGHDWGGAVAWAFAMAHPDRLDRLIIINGPHPVVFGRELRENPAQRQASRYMELFRSPEAEAILSADDYAYLATGVFGEALERGHLDEDDLRAYIDAWSQPGALTGGLNYYRANIRALDAGDPVSGFDDTAARHAVLEVPTLVIWGERDAALLTGNLEGLDAYVADLTVRRIPDGTHWVVHEQPDRVNGYIREFLGGR